MQINLIEVLDTVREMVGKRAGALCAEVEVMEYSAGNRRMTLRVWVDWCDRKDVGYYGTTVEEVLTLIRGALAGDSAPTEVTVTT